MTPGWAFIWAMGILSLVFITVGVIMTLRERR
jgi:hypothetical protein